MKILFIADPLNHFKIAKDSTYAMMKEAHERGHELFACEPQHLLYLSTEKAGSKSAPTCFAIADKISLKKETNNYWYTKESHQQYALQDFDVILMRKDPPFDIEYVTTTWLLERAEKEGAYILNSPKALRDHSEKFAITEFPEFITPTLITRDSKSLIQFHQKHKEVIFKPLDGMGGKGVFKINEEALNLGSIIETISENGTRNIMAQRFIPDVKKGDKRILLIDGKAVDYALARIPQGTEVRGNLAAGGLGIAQALTEKDREIAEKIGPILAKRGLFLIGIDVIGDCLTEINVTSPTCFQEISQQKNCNVAKQFIDALEKNIKAKNLADKT